MWFTTTYINQLTTKVTKIFLDNGIYEIKFGWKAANKIRNILTKAKDTISTAKQKDAIHKINCQIVHRSQGD